VKLNYEKIESILKSKQDICVEAIERDKTLPIEFIEKIEMNLDTKLPFDYLWFLNKYKFVSIYDNEIFNIYPELNNNNNGYIGDIFYQYYLDLENKLININELPIFEDEFGQLFILKYVDDWKIYIKYSESGEYEKVYSENFLEFIKKQLEDCE